MSVQRTQSGAPAPRRAEPLQPDRPGQGNTQLPEAEPSAEHAADDAADKQKQQTKDALENVREGYR